MKKIEQALKLAKDLTYADKVTEGAKEYLKSKIDLALNEVKNNVALADVRLSLPIDELIKSLGDCVDENSYTIEASSEGRWWIIHKGVGSGEPLEQWLTGKPKGDEA